MREVKRVPIATLTLIALNLAVAFWAATSTDAFGILGFDPKSPSPVAAITSMFAHVNLVHLLGNLVFLAAVGPAVEFVAGAFRFATVYLVGGICGVLLHWILNQSATEPSVLMGASGAIAACAAFYSARFFNLKVPVAPNVAIPIWSVFLVWAGLQGLGAVVKLGQETGGVAFWAHLGGLGAGAAMSLFYRAPKLASLHFGHDVLDKMNSRGPAAVAEAARRHLQDHPNDARAHWELAEAYRQLGDVKDEISALLPLVSTPRGADALARLAELGALDSLTPIQRIRLADSHRKTHVEVAYSLYESVAKGDCEQAPEAIFALIEIDLQAAPDRAQSWSTKLSEGYPLHPATDRARAKGWLS